MPTIGVVGLGLMGASFALALKKARPELTIVGFDRDVATAHPLVMDAATHDRLVAGVSHAALLLSVGYVLALSGRADWPEAAKVAASGFRDMSRLAAGDPAMSAGITRTNRDNLLEQLDAISHSLARLRRHLEADDPRLVELFEEARSVRERCSKDVDNSRPTPRPSPRGVEGASPAPRPPPGL